MSRLEEYIEGVPAERRAALERIRDTVRDEVPEAEDGWSYGIPTFMYRGKPLLGFHSVRSHMSLFPYSGWVVSELKDRLEGFSLSSGTIRFTVERPVPDQLVREIVRKRIEQISRPKG